VRAGTAELGTAPLSLPPPRTLPVPFGPRKRRGSPGSPEPGVLGGRAAKCGLHFGIALSRYAKVTVDLPPEGAQVSGIADARHPGTLLPHLLRRPSHPLPSLRCRESPPRSLAPAPPGSRIRPLVLGPQPLIAPLWLPLMSRMCGQGPPSMRLPHGRRCEIPRGAGTGPLLTWELACLPSPSRGFLGFRVPNSSYLSPFSFLFPEEPRTLGSPSLTSPV
jgi:hypothetical protein